MFSLIKNSLKLTNKNITLATPLILFSLISSLYVLFSIGGNLVGLLIAFILFILMSAAFVSGWFKMIKTVVQSSGNETTSAIFMEFPAGVGEYILSILGAVINIVILTFAVYILVYLIGMKFIGNINIPTSAMAGAITSQEALKSFLLSLPEEQLQRLSLWNFLMLAGMMLESFLIMLYFPVIFFKTKNPFKAVFITLKDLFSRRFGYNLLLFILIFISYFVLSYTTTIFGSNIIVHFILTLVNFYYMVFISVLIFNYYYNNFVRIGSNIDKTV